MELEFTPLEVRVLGCLIEKESTTPESYPLTLNGLIRAANQSSNREPVMTLSEMQVQEALDSLSSYRLVSTRSASDSRVPKYSHRLRDRRTPEFDFTQPELAVIAVLLLRGAQTLGEIRTRCARIYRFDDMQTLIATLEGLGEREDGPYVKQLARRPGQKEARYTHLFCAEDEESRSMDATADTVSSGYGENGIVELEERIARLEQELAQLQEKFQAFARQFD